MKVDFKQELKDHKGEAIQNQDPDTKSSKPWTLADLAEIALTRNFKEDEAEEAKDQFKRMSLAAEIAKGTEELIAEQVALIKERIGYLKSPVLLYGGWNALEGNE